MAAKAPVALPGRCVGKSRHGAACAVLAAAGGEATNYVTNDRAGAERLIRGFARAWGLSVTLRTTEYGVLVLPAPRDSTPE